MRFSQRIGKTSVRQALQVEEVDRALENRLWNNFLSHFIERIDDTRRVGRESNRVKVCRIIWEEFFENRKDEIPVDFAGKVYIPQALTYFKEWFFGSQWFEKYDFIEFIVYLDNHFAPTGFTQHCNSTLKKESAGYRIVEEKIVQITSEEEIAAIQEAIHFSSKWEPVETHLKTALDFLSNRENPDFRNSVKESISAVEAFCVILTNDSNTTLGKALAQIEQEYKIHGALKTAFSALYGYTSDSGGIRHSLLEDDIAVTVEDAKFMLVSCSAFINYLRSKL